nr:rhamnosyltransferase [Raoultella sp. NCTC 9187]
MEGENIDIKMDNEKISHNIDYIIGASFFITNKVLRDVGELSEDYFLYFEEIDYCIRAKNKGYNIFPISDSVVYHKEGASTKKIVREFYQITYRLKTGYWLAKNFTESIII